MAKGGASRSSEPPPDSPIFGDTFTDVSADYELGKRLGAGNFAKVVLGRSKRGAPHWKLAAGAEVAIKVVKKPSSARAVEKVRMLEAEVEILRSIHHPNIVQFYGMSIDDSNERGARYYLVSDLKDTDLRYARHLHV